MRDFLDEFAAWVAEDCKSVRLLKDHDTEYGVGWAVTAEWNYRKRDNERICDYVCATGDGLVLAMRAAMAQEPQICVLGPVREPT